MKRRDDLLERLGRCDSCALSDALDKLGLDGAVTGLERFSANRKIFGRVVTVRLGKAGEGTAALPGRHLCTAAIEAASPGDVLVVEQRTGRDAAAWGGTLSRGALLRGLAGVVVEGPARDLDESRDLGFPVFARGHTARTARGRVVETATNQPVRVGEVTVRAGDYVLGDATAVVFIAADAIGRVLDTAEGIARREAAMARALEEGGRLSEVMGRDYENMLKTGDDGNG